jgi:NAD(P)-dependent dehydrogenase (short-subunit alcohol dehydrogenase family)
MPAHELDPLAGFRLDGKVAIVTGASSGLGARFARVLDAAGASVVLVARRRERLEALASELRDAMAVPCDLARLDVSSVVEVTLARYGRVDVLVNNAGISLIRSAEDTTAAEYRRVIEVNLVAPFLLARVFGRKMLEARSGSIINVASIAGLAAVSDRAAYNASKHGLVGLTRTLAAEWGGRGVRVNAVCPGWVKTEMDHADQARGTYTDADITQRIPMARFASPDDIARAIAFLADPVESAFINGHTLTIDGGWTADASWESVRLKKR